MLCDASAVRGESVKIAVPFDRAESLAASVNPCDNTRVAYPLPAFAGNIPVEVNNISDFR